VTETRRKEVKEEMIIERGKKGFTLIEMLIVLIIIAVLAVVVLPRIMNARRKAKDDATRQTMAELDTAVENFEADVGCYPVAISDLLVKPTGAYTGKGVVGAVVGDVIVSDATDLWRGPYFKTTGTSIAVPADNAGSWTVKYDLLTTLGKVKIVSTKKGMDGNYYSDW
jgi:general secretion pathway protein G